MLKTFMENARRDPIGKAILLGIQHTFAMFGATVLVPALTGLHPAIALFCAGIGTILFHLVTGFKVPAFLGSSFAFIGAIIATIQSHSGGAEVGSPEYIAAIPYAIYGVIWAGGLYLVLALLVKLFGANRIRSFFPPIVTGTIVIVIGLMLAPTAISSISGDSSVLFRNGVALDSWVNWAIAGFTVLTIILVTIFAKGFFKLVPILIGIVAGYVLSLIVGVVDFQPVQDASWFSLPQFVLPKHSWDAVLLIAPIAIVTFVEHIGDMTANGSVVGKDFIEDPGLHRTLIGDGLATMFAGFVGGPANTTYSENTGVLAATRNYNPFTLLIAAVFAILLSFFGKAGAILQTLPGPVMGGVSVVLFGMIAAVGLRTLVENQVDFKSSRNLLIVAVMLVLGLGAGGAIQIAGVEISGVALAAVLGIILSKILPERMDNGGVKK